jgi:peptidyl-prolyl cis-trans isomerase SurA
MDRRVVVGLVGIALAGVAENGHAQTPSARDPSGQYSVGLAPIPSITDSINNTTSYSPVVPLPSSAVPSSPVGQGTGATLPRAPVPRKPIVMTPIDPIQRSINRGIGTGLFSSMFSKPADRPSAAILRTPPRVEPVSKLDTSTIPSIWSSSPRNPPSAGRPAPFAGRVPEAPRAQADPPARPSAEPLAGRPAPFAYQRPPAARPQATASNPPAYLPAEIPSASPEPVAVAPMPEPVRPSPASPEPSPSPLPLEPPPVIPLPAPPEPTAPAVPVELPVIPSPAPPEPTAPAVPVELPVIPSPAPPESTAPAVPVELPVIPSPTPAEPTLPALPGKLPPAPVIEPPSTPPAIILDPLPALDPAPAAAQEPPVVTTPIPVEAAPAPSGPVDKEVNRTSLDEAAVRTQPVKARKLPYAALRAAAVGDEIITINELESAVNEQMKEIPAGQLETMSKAQLHQVRNQIAASRLNQMIDQALIVQQAKEKLKKNPKAKQAFEEFVEKQWTSDELPILLSNTATSNVHELRIKLASEGKSYDSMKQSYRKSKMAREFLMAEIHNKLSADMIEMRKYYNEHLDKFDQPERMTWREIEINFARYPSRAEARKKAEEVLARLLHNEDFAAIARSVSNGPTATKGGLYVEMQPGSYGIPVVNDELNRIPTGQVSQILEAPGSFHIIRVDSRREKGPLRFDEVQDQVRNLVWQENFQKAVGDHVAELRAKTLIRTIFDNTESDPELARRGSGGR